MGARPSRPCLDCGALVVNAPRCPRCAMLRQRQQNARRPSRAIAGYPSNWEALSRAILDRDGQRCAYCHGPARTVDHVIPLRLGGSNDGSNLVAACRACNSRRMMTARHAVK